MQKLAEKLNRSQRLGRLISFFAGRLANYRGAPIVLGILLVFISLGIQIVAVLTALKGLLLAGIIILHIAIIIALLGVLLAEPLGKG